MAVKFKFAMKNSSKNNGKKTMERTGRKKNESSAVVSSGV